MVPAVAPAQADASFRGTGLTGPRIAFVPPWFGEAIPGGSETEVRTMALHLHQAGMEVEILTTCIRDSYDDWGRNHHAPGT